MAERGRPKYPDILTPRQYEVLELLREGLTNPEIAERLGISPDGAKWHVREILWKLDVPSREEAARWQRERRESAPMARLRLGAGSWRSEAESRMRDTRLRRRRSLREVTCRFRHPRRPIPI
jgi:DNA-binding CsgD family transcriptional regulator